METFIRYVRKIKHELESSLKHTKGIINMLYSPQTTTRNNANRGNFRDSPRKKIKKLFRANSIFFNVLSYF